MCGRKNDGDGARNGDAIIEDTACCCCVEVCLSAATLPYSVLSKHLAAIGGPGINLTLQEP